MRQQLLALTALLISLAVPSHADNEPDFYVDSPVFSIWQEPEIEVGGWIWAGIEDPVLRVVLESGSWSYPLDSGLERGDVAAHLGKPEATESGFHGRLLLPAAMGSDELLQIVAYRQSGDRVVLKNIRYRPVKLSTLWSSWLDQ